MINFSASKSDQELAYKIAKRASEKANELGFRYSLLDAEMDILACHLNGNPLKLPELLKADDTNFSHDVFGIRKHINRDTGKLENCFSPRYSKPENYIDEEVREEFGKLLLRIKKMSEE